MAGLDASTVTPGKTPPDASRTTPVIDAWANAAAGASSTATNTAIRMTSDRISFLRMVYVPLV
jgi:hypothetical protein